MVSSCLPSFSLKLQSCTNKTKTSPDPQIKVVKVACFGLCRASSLTWVGQRVFMFHFILTKIVTAVASECLISHLLSFSTSMITNNCVHRLVNSVNLNWWNVIRVNNTWFQKNCRIYCTYCSFFYNIMQCIWKIPLSDSGRYDVSLLCGPCIFHKPFSNLFYYFRHKNVVSNCPHDKAIPEMWSWMHPLTNNFQKSLRHRRYLHMTKKFEASP